MSSSPLLRFPVPPHVLQSIPTISSALLRFLEPFSWSLSWFLGIHVIPDSFPSRLLRSFLAYSQRLLVLLDQEYYFAD